MGAFEETKESEPEPVGSRGATAPATVSSAARTAAAAGAADARTTAAAASDVQSAAAQAAAAEAAMAAARQAAAEASEFQQRVQLCKRTIAGKRMSTGDGLAFDSWSAAYQKEAIGRQPKP